MDDTMPDPGWSVVKSGAMKRKKSVRPVDVAYLCHFQPEPEGGFTVTCPKLPPVVTYGETLEEARANAREAIALCLEVMLEDGAPVPAPDGDLTSPIDQLVPVARLRA
jgi:antitoxin HicB